MQATMDTRMECASLLLSCSNSGTGSALTWVCASLTHFPDADAIRAAEFARDKVWDAEQKRLRRSFCRGPSDVGGFADDYAFLISGLLDLHAASGDEQWLRFALQLQTALDELFWDDGAGVFTPPAFIVMLSGLHVGKWFCNCWIY